MTKGIVDPWRVDVPLRPEPKPERGERIDLDEIDLDEDIRPSGTYVLRGTHAAIRADHPQIRTEADGLAVIVGLLLDVVQDPACARSLVAFGFTLGKRTWGAPSDGKAAHYKAGEAVLWFKEAERVDVGLLDLVRCLTSPPLRGRPNLRQLTPMFR